jgi:hypothetical protein
MWPTFGSNARTVESSQRSMRHARPVPDRRESSMMGATIPKISARWAALPLWKFSTTAVGTSVDNLGVPQRYIKGSNGFWCLPCLEALPYLIAIVDISENVADVQRSKLVRL